MPSLDRNQQTTCNYCGKNVKKVNLSRHKKSCTSGTKSCPQCPNFFCKTQVEMDHHTATKHAIPSKIAKPKCNICEEEYPSFYSLQRHKQSVHGTTSRIENVNVNLDAFMGDYDDQSLREELRACQHFLVDSEFVRGRQHVFNFASTNVTPKFLQEKIQQVFESLHCAAKVNLALGFVLRNVEDGSYRYFYAHENNLLLDRSLLIANKEDMTEFQQRLDDLNIVELSTRERSSTKWKLLLTTNVTIFAALLKSVPIGCKDILLPPNLVKRSDVNCLTYKSNKERYNDNLCLLRAVCMHKTGSERLEEETKKLFNAYLNANPHLSVQNFRGVGLEDLHIVERLAEVNILVFDIEVLDGGIIGELAERSLRRFNSTATLLRYNNHICYVTDVNKVFKSFRCSTCNTFFTRSSNLQRHMPKCEELVKNIYPKSVYQLRETLFDKLRAFDIEVAEGDTLYNNFAVFDFESICVKNCKVVDTETTTWVGKHEPISVSITSTLLEEPIFICDIDPHSLVSAFVNSLESLAEKNKLEMNLKFHDIATKIKEKLERVLSAINTKRRQLSNGNERLVDMGDDDEEEMSVSTQFLLTQKNKLIELQEHFERYVNTLPVFGFNSAKYDLNLIKAYLIPLLVNEKEIEPTVIKKANQYISFKFGNVQFLDIMNFLGGATSLDSFLKAYKTSETKGFFPYEWFDSPEKLNCSSLPPYNEFFSRLRNCNPLDKAHSDYQSFVNSGYSNEEALKKLCVSTIPPTGQENYEYLQQVWKNHDMQSFKDFLRWYNNKDVVPTLEAMKKMIDFYHSKQIDMLKLGCTLPNLANICLHSSTNAKFYPFPEGDKDLLEKIREDMVGGPSIVFTRKAVVGQTCIRSSSNTCKSIVGIDASQLYPYAMCQPMPTGLYTRWEFDADLQRFKPRSNKARSFENMVMAFFQSSRPECKIESFYTTGTQRKIDCFSVDGFCSHCNTIFEALGCFYHFCECQEVQPCLTDEDILKGQRKREMDELRRSYLREKNYSIIEMRECEWKLHLRQNHEIKSFVRSTFPYKRPLSFENLLSRIRKDELFGYVQCDLRVPENLREKFESFPPIFKNILVSRSDIGDFMKKYAEENKLMTQPRRMLISSFHLINGTIITPLLNFYLDLGLECDRIYRFVQYTPMKCFNSFVQSAVDARRKGDENPHSSVVAETMKLLANSSYGYQIMDRSRHTVTKYMNDEKAHKAINSKFFKKLNHLNDNLYEIESVKAEVEHKEPIIVGFFILQYAKLRMLELYYNFFQKYCDFNSFEEMEMDTDSLYLAVAHDSIEDCIKPDMRDVWNNIRMNDCCDTFAADSSNNFFPRTCCSKHIKHDKREPGLFKEEFRCTEMICLCSKTYCCFDQSTDKIKFSSKGLNKRTLEESGAGPLEKYRRVLDEKTNVQSTNRGFRTIQHLVCTYEQTKRGISYFYPKRIVLDDGINTKPLLL